MEGQGTNGAELSLHSCVACGDKVTCLECFNVTGVAIVHFCLHCWNISRVSEMKQFRCATICDYVRCLYV